MNGQSVGMVLHVHSPFLAVEGAVRWAPVRDAKSLQDAVSRCPDDWPVANFVRGGDCSGTKFGKNKAIRALSSPTN